MNSSASEGSVLIGPQIPLPDQYILHKYLSEKISHDKDASKKPALIHNGITTTYQELEDKSSQLAVQLHHIIKSTLTEDPSTDCIIAVCMHPSDKLITTLLAILKTGCAYLPIEPTIATSRIKYILTNSRPVAILTDAPSKNVTEALHEAELLKLDFNELINNFECLHQQTISDLQELIPMPLKLACVLYTSGSTGTPKGVRLSHKVVMNRLNWQWQTYPFKENEVCCFKTALTFVDAIAEIFGALLQLQPLVIMPKEVVIDTEHFVCALEEAKVTRLVLVPSLLRNILLLSKQKKQQHAEASVLDKLQLWVCSGESFPPDLLTDFFQVFNSGNHIIANFYGSTEVMGDVTAEWFRSTKDISLQVVNNKVPIGEAIANTTIYLLDEQLNIVPMGEIGEIYASGFNVANGYIGDQNGSKFIQNPFSPDEGYETLYRTGDFGRILNERTIVFEGRTDSQLKVHGKRVDMTEIEKCLKNIQTISRQCVLCFKPGEKQQTIIAFVVLSPTMENYKLSSILENLRDYLPCYMLPEILAIPDMPLLPNGKIDRQTLLRDYESNKLSKQLNSAKISLYDLSNLPNNLQAAARDLYEIIAETVGISLSSIISAEKSFYNIGGNSLNSVETVVQLKEKGYRITVGQFIKCQTLSEVITILTKDPEMNGVSTLEANYKPVQLQLQHKDEAIEIISQSFAKKGDLEFYLGVRPQSFIDILEEIWESLIATGYSFGMIDEDGKFVGIALNFDLYDEPELNPEPNLGVILTFLDFYEKPVLKRIPYKEKGKILHGFMMATVAKFSAADNVLAIQAMEEYNILQAAQKGFEGILTTNTNALTQQVCQELDYVVMTNVQVNEYVSADGSRPFALAPDTHRSKVMLKLFS